MRRKHLSAVRQLVLAAIAVTLLCASMFDDSSVLQMQLRFDFDAFCDNPDKQDCADVPAEIVYTDLDGEAVSVDVRLRIRGRWSNRTAGCQLPALFVYFNESETAGTPFAGQSMLPLTTHCRHLHKRYSEYLLSEYLAHRIYALLSPVSIRARLAEIEYIDSRSNRHRKRYGFFTEHFAGVARRTDRTLYEPDHLHVAEADPQGMSRHALFQYMIGNLDWSAVQSHNVALFRADDGNVIPAPFDFDYSGLVSAEYASPPSGIWVSNVTTRVFRGYCWPGVDWSAVFDEFTAIKDDVFAEAAALPDMSGGEQRRIRVYLKRFYEKIESSEARQAIVDSCRPVPEPLQ